MRSCFGSILLVILVVVIALTAFYQWETNDKIEFSARAEGEPALNKTTTPIEEVSPKKDPRSAIEQNVMKMEVPAEPESTGGEAGEASPEKTAEPASTVS